VGATEGVHEAGSLEIMHDNRGVHGVCRFATSREKPRSAAILTNCECHIVPCGVRHGSLRPAPSSSDPLLPGRGAVTE
jgi:hypothetical protein